MIMVWNQVGKVNRKTVVFVFQSTTTCFHFFSHGTLNANQTPNHTEQMLNKIWTYLFWAQHWIFLSRLPSHQWRGAVLLQCRPCPMHCDPRPIWIQPCLDLEGAAGVGINTCSMLGQNNWNPQLNGNTYTDITSDTSHAPTFSQVSEHNCHSAQHMNKTGMSFEPVRVHIVHACCVAWCDITI